MNSPAQQALQSHRNHYLFSDYYLANRAQRIRYDRERREANREKHLARHKLYNDTKRNKT